MPRLKLKIELVHTGDDAPTKTAKELSRQLRITALTVLLTLGMLIGLTMAWFASNKKVDADVMKVDVQTNPNLVIKPAGAYTAATDTFANATASAVAGDEHAPFDTGAVARLSPATHVFYNNAHAEWDSDETNFPYASIWPNGTGALYETLVTAKPAYTGLKYNYNSSTIAANTGLGNASSLYPPVALDDENASEHYYQDFAVQIASVDGALPADSLTVTMDVSKIVNGTPDPTAPLSDYHQAASIDVYLGSPKDDHYIGTLNKAGLNPLTGDAQTSLSIDLTNNEVPCNTDGCITVTLRFYFDGALQPAGDHYVYNPASGTAVEGVTYYDAAGVPQTVTAGTTDVSGMYTRVVGTYVRSTGLSLANLQLLVYFEAQPLPPSP